MQTANDQVSPVEDHELRDLPCPSLQRYQSSESSSKGSHHASKLLSDIKKLPTIVRTRVLTTLSDDGAPEDVQDPDNEEEGGPIPKMWTPLVLKRKVLLGFASVFLMMIIALEILFLFSNRNNGLATTDSGKHYLWTYGPTAGMPTSHFLVSSATC